MTQYIKLDSDRPDWSQTIRRPDGSVVDLTDATNVQLLMWGPSGSLLIDDAASVPTPPVGEVLYDFDNTQIAEAGTNHIELRVDWADGDSQWFPTDEGSYVLEVTPPPGDRDAEKITGWPVLTVADGETHTVPSGETESYKRVENAGTVQAPMDATVRTGGI